MSKFSGRIRRPLAVVFLSSVLLSCGGALVTAGISGTGIVVGVLTGFGSIYVNGVEYDIESATFDIDGVQYDSAAEAQQNMALGMVVRLEAKDQRDGTGIAYRVVYDDSVEGPIEQAPTQVNGDPNRLSFTVLSREVQVDAVGTTFDGIDFADLDQAVVVEVSGFTDGDGVIHATRVEGKGQVVPGTTTVELHGRVATLASDSFMLDGVLVHFDGQTRFEDMQPGDLANGLRVEVKGVYQSDGSVSARKIEGETDDDNEVPTSGGTVELQGIVYGFVSVSEFRLGDVTVDASALDASVTARLANGVQVEIKGQMDNGTLIAESIKYRGAEAELKADVMDVNPNASTITVSLGAGNELTLQVTAESLLKDDRDGSGDAALTLADLAAESPPLAAELSMRQQGGDWLLVVLKLKNGIDKYEVEGTLEAVDSDTVTLFGLILPLDPSVSVPVGLQAGDTIEAKDTDKDGDIDEIEADD